MGDQFPSCPRLLATVVLALLAVAAELTAQQGPSVVRPADLEREAAHVPPAVAGLYRALARPSDDNYAQRALEKIEQFLKSDGVEEGVKLRAAETALSAVLRFHAGAHPRPLAGPNPWAQEEKRLEARLLDVRLRQVRLAETDATAALLQAEHLRLTYPNHKAVLAEVVRLRVRLAEERFKAKDYRAVRNQLAQVEELSLAGVEERKHFQEMQERLKTTARALFKEAIGLSEPAAAVGRLQEALVLCPELPGLRDELLRRQNAYAILTVGVHELPENLSPATAWTEAETQAITLLFERLVEPRYLDKSDQVYQQVYQPRLAVHLPGILPGGRRFQLPPSARWSDGNALTSLDVRHSAQLLRASGRALEWEEVLAEPRVENDPLHIDFQFRQLPLDPLARLAFWVLPQTFRGQALERPDHPDFAREPVGSGPFRYAGRKVEDGRTYAVFTANPHYQRHGRPHLREIRFFVSADPARDFRHATRPLHLLLDLPTERIESLQSPGVCDLRTMENRRVYFLAVNHRVKALQNQDLRRALAHAIDRKRILDDCFRGSAITIHWWQVTRQPRHAGFHRPLYGPFPASSWANDPTYQSRFELAKTYAQKAGVKTVELTLKYPDDDPRVAQACREIAAQVARLEPDAGLTVRLKLMPLPPRQLKQAVDQRDYELAYYHLDYADESYWLWPLFDTRPEALAPGGSNFLGYKNDDALERLFRQATAERDFAELKKKTHDLHGHFFEHMPFIPLWQLDTHLAFHPNLAATHVDPLGVFTAVDEWTLRRQGKD